VETGRDLGSAPEHGGKSEPEMGGDRSAVEMGRDRGKGGSSAGIFFAWCLQQMTEARKKTKKTVSLFFHFFLSYLFFIFWRETNFSWEAV
jgi:hypothetical protein